MKSVGEAMAIGRTFKESLQKCLRSLEIGRPESQRKGAKTQRFKAGIVVLCGFASSRLSVEFIFTALYR